MSWPFYKSDTKVSSIISNLADVEKRWKSVDLFLCQCPGTELRFEGFSCYNKMDNHCDYAKGDAPTQKARNTVAVTVSARRAMILADLILDGRTPEGIFKDCDTQFANAKINLRQDLPSPIKIDFPEGKTGTSCPMKDVKAPWPMTPSPLSSANGKWDPAKSRRVELILTVAAGVQGKPKIDEKQCMGVQSTMSKNAQTTTWDEDVSCCKQKTLGWCYVVKPMMRHHRGKHWCCPKQNCADLTRGPGGGKPGAGVEAGGGDSGAGSDGGGEGSTPAQTGGKCKWPPRKGNTGDGKDRPFCPQALAKRFSGDEAKLCEKEGLRRACPAMCKMTCEKAIAQHESQASHDARKSDLSAGSTTASGIGVDGGHGGKVCCKAPGVAPRMYNKCENQNLPAPGKCGKAEGAGQRFKTLRAAPGALRAAPNDLEDLELPAKAAEEAKSTASRKELLDIVKETDTELHDMAGGRTTYEGRNHGRAAGPAYEREFTQPHRDHDIEDALLEV